MFSSVQTLPTRVRELELVASTIDKKLSSQVMRNYHHFVTGLELITDISEELKASRNLCTHGRKEIETVDKALTHSILATLQKQRSMARCRIVILRLHEVYALLRKENEINALLKRDEFIKSVSIYKSCLKKLATSGLNKFTCLDALRARFLRTGELISTKVKQRLLSLAKRFQPDAFRNLIQAMVNIGDYKVLAEYLRKFIQTAVDENASDAITPFLTRDYIASLLSMSASQEMAKAMIQAESKSEEETLGNHIAMVSPIVTDSPQKTNGITHTFESSSTSPTVHVNLPNTPLSSASSSYSQPTSPLTQLMSPSSLSPDAIASLPKKPFRSLVVHLDRSQFSLAFLTLTSSMLDNLYAIQSMMIILSDVAREERRKGESSGSASSLATTVNEDGDEVALTEAESIGVALDQALAYLQSSLPHFWSHITGIVTEFLRSQPLSSQHISVDDFVRVLQKGREFVAIGERFAQAGGNAHQRVARIDLPADASRLATGASQSEESPSLRQVLQTKSMDYIRQFVRDSLTQLAAAFEQDTFKPIIVEDDFNIDTQIKELQLLKQYLNETNEDASSSSPSMKSIDDANLGDSVDPELFDKFLQGYNPFARAVLEQKNAYEMRNREARLAEESKAAADAARLAASTRPPLRAPGSGPIRSSALNLSLGRPNFALPTVGGTTGGVPTVQPRALAHRQAQQAAMAAAQATTNGTDTTAASSSSSAAAAAPTPNRPFILASTLALAKVFGRYLSLLRSFPQHADQAMDGFKDVIELFVYTVILQFGTNQSGFFQPISSNGSASTQAALAEYRHPTSSPTYLVDTFPNLRTLVCSVKNRVELGVFGDVTPAEAQPSSSSPQSTPWAKDFQQADVMAAAAALAQAQANLSEFQSNGPTSPTSGAPLTIAAASAAQSIAAASLMTPSDKKDGSFFSKLKGKISSTSLADRKERDLPPTPSNTVLNAVNQAASHLAAVSSSHPPPQVVTLAPKIATELDSPDALHGLGLRMNVYESLDFIFQLFEHYLPHLPHLLPSSMAQLTRRYQKFAQYVTRLHLELQGYLSGSCAPIMLPKETFSAKLNQCRWDIKDLQTKYNAYVDTILNSQKNTKQ